MTEPSEEGLLKAVKEALDKDGRLNKFRAELRASIMSVLNKPASNQKAPEIPEEMRLINDLIKEYLNWNGYRYAEQFLISESGQDVNMSRDVMAAKLGVLDDNRSTKIPLLYFIVADFQKKIN